jgi:beta-hydroxylase
MQTTVRLDQPLPTEGRGIAGQIIVRFLAWAEKLNRKYSLVGNPPVYSTDLFPWVKGFEADFPQIKAELLAVMPDRDRLANFQDLVPDVGTISKDNLWKSFLFTGYGATSQRNVALCPKTWQALQKIPKLQTAMFSIFEPGKHLAPHRGPFNGVLRLHLGLIVPDEPEKIAIRVHDQIIHWKEGRVEIFDDSFEHEAWNHSDKVRVVLFVDFERPVRFPASLVNWVIFKLAIFSPYIRDAAVAQKKWENEYYS